MAGTLKTQRICFFELMEQTVENVLCLLASKCLINVNTSGSFGQKRALIEEAMTVIIYSNYNSIPKRSKYM